MYSDNSVIVNIGYEIVWNTNNKYAREYFKSYNCFKRSVLK